MNMKRFICVILSVFVMLGVFAGCSGSKKPAPSASPTAEPTASPDAGKNQEPIEASEWAGISHSVFEKNQFDVLMSRHSSLKYDFTYTERPEWKNSTWETAECVFADWPGLGYENYSKGRTGYRKTTADDSKVYYSAVIDFNDNYESFYKVFGLDETEFNDTEHETTERAYKEDGLIHLISVYDSEASKTSVEKILGRDYAGEKIHAELIADAETYELVSNSLFKETDGGLELVYSVEASYDTEEPESCRELKARFETGDTPRYTFAATVNAGSDDEYEVSFNVPQGTMLQFDSGEESVMFSDPEYISIDGITGWDGVSDLNVYVLTDPSDAVYDRYYALSSEALKPRETAYSVGDVTVGAIVEANKSENVLKNHETVFCVAHNYFDSDWYFCYRDGLYYEGTYDESYENLIDSDGTFYRNSYDGETVFIGNWLVMSDEEKALFGAVTAADMSTPINNETTVKEELVDVVDNGNGTFSVFTRMNETNTVESLTNKGFTNLENFAGAVIEIEYVISAETLEILCNYEYLIVGETRDLLTFMALCYDSELPLTVNDMIAAKVRFLTCDGAEKTKTIRIIYDAGTKNEVSYMTVVPEDDIVNMIFRQGYTKVYADAQKTELFQGKPDETGVFNLYLFYGD